MAPDDRAEEQGLKTDVEATLPYHQSSPSEQLEAPQPGEQDENGDVQPAEEQVEPFLQHKFLEAMRELHMTVEQELLPPSNIIEIEVRALQDVADAAEAEALQVLQQKEEELLALARIVQRFHEEIKQVLPMTPHKRNVEEMQQDTAGQEE